MGETAVLDKVKRFIKDPEIRVDYIVASGILNWVADRRYIEYYFKRKLKYKPNLDNPQTLCEKLNWLKLYNRRPEYTIMVDKYKVKSYVADRIGSEHVVPLLGVWNKYEEIDFEKLPNKFVLKCTHDGGPVVCTNKKAFNIDYYRRVFHKKLKKNYYYSRWPGDW